MCITLREYEAIVSKRTVQNCRRADDSLIAIYSSVHYFLHLTFANAAGGRGGEGGIVHGTASHGWYSRPTDTYVNFPLSAIPTRRFPVYGADQERRRVPRFVRDEKKRERERDREEEKFKRIALRAERPDELSSERSSERRLVGRRSGNWKPPPLCDFTATFRQSAGTKWPIVARLKRRAEGSAMIFGNQPFFLFTGGGRGKYG